jgi:hypothetical protein
LKALLLRQGVEVSELQADTTSGTEKLAKGSLVVRMDQPYCRMADMLLDKQYYRADDPSPYDDCGWTLGPLFDVQTTRVRDASVLTKASSPAAAQWADTPAYPTKGKVPRVGVIHTWQNTQDDGWVRLAFEGAKVPYEYISVHDLRDTADLRSRFDVLLFSPTGGSAQSIVDGRATDPLAGDTGIPRLGRRPAEPRHPGRHRVAGHGQPQEVPRQWWIVDVPRRHLPGTGRIRPGERCQHHRPKGALCPRWCLPGREGCEELACHRPVRRPSRRLLC